MLNQIVRWACSLVARRAALLSGVAVASILVQTDRASLPGPDGKQPLRSETERIWVGVDGRSVFDSHFGGCADPPLSLIEHYPNFECTLRESLRTLVGEQIEQKVDIGLAKDGSGVGGKLTDAFVIRVDLCHDLKAALCALQALKQHPQ